MDLFHDRDAGVREPNGMDLPRTDREIKVKIATRLHVALQSRKILEGTPIHQMVTEALDAYFATHPVAVLELPDPVGDPRP